MVFDGAFAFDHESACLEMDDTTEVHVFSFFYDRQIIEAFERTHGFSCHNIQPAFIGLCIRCDEETTSGPFAVADIYEKLFSYKLYGVCFNPVDFGSIPEDIFQHGEHE